MHMVLGTQLGLKYVECNCVKRTSALLLLQLSLARRCALRVCAGKKVGLSKGMNESKTSEAAYMQHHAAFLVNMKGSHFQNQCRRGMTLSLGIVSKLPL